MRSSYAWLLPAAVCACFVGTQSLATGATYSFDITSAIDSHFAGPLETPIDLGGQFQQIDSATLLLSGTFSPGIKQAFTSPPVAHDGLVLAVKLGDEGTSFIDKRVVAYPNLNGLSGQVNFSLPLLGTGQDAESLPVLFPAANQTPDLGFLLDGRFAISALGFDTLAAIYSELQAPTFEVTSFVLQIEGSAVPEPAALVLAAVCCIAVPCCRVRGR